MNTRTSDSVNLRRYLLGGSIFLLLTIAYWGGITNLVERWSAQEEYSHGFFLPMLAIYFAWCKQDLLRVTERKPSWIGVAVIAIGTSMLLIGELSALYILVHYSLILTLYGLILAFGGIPYFRILFWPLLLLVFAIPLPYFIDASLSYRLQLLSSELGVWVIRSFHIPVYLEGNVIDLGTYKLQVVDACSGLRYLYPLMGIGYIAAYLFSAPFWQRALVFLSTIPITIIMNSLRIGMIGVLVDKSGSSAADGFLHQFEGWVVFMASAALLLLEIYAISRSHDPRLPFREILGIPEYLSPPQKRHEQVWTKHGATPIRISVVLLAGATISTLLIGARHEDTPSRLALSQFPENIGEWISQPQIIPPNILDTLQLSDYLNANFKDATGTAINLYIAYYETQRKGVSPHSPRVCIPGGGWKINTLTRATIPITDDKIIPVNRVEIEKDGHKELVYYWFQQRGRSIANEYLMKLYLLYDSIFKNRTDGALVRVTMPIKPDSPIKEQENKIYRYIQHLQPDLSEFIPD